ncbi:unnamed protein product [Phytomonas sp. Hart1]|nr:unnamed protein product [Phytomonas sp. Hart1]|eukprot:CCW68760.1 unnamed protein product [Phytomonas sp. isolate Hart1]
MDLNELLVNTTTSAEDGGASSEIWIRGKHKRKRPSQEAHVSGSNHHEPAKMSRQNITEEDRKPAMPEKTREWGGNFVSSAPVGSSSRNGALSSSILARLVIDYVFARELGGRHGMWSVQNKISGIHGRDEEQIASQLAAERACGSSMASRAVIHHLPIFHSIGGLRSSVKWENYPDAVVKYRLTLQMCDIRRDLIGGVTAEHTPHFRNFALRILEAALEGQTPQNEPTQGNDEASPGSSPLFEKSDLSRNDRQNKFNEVQLSFQTESRSSKDEKGTQAFVLDDFLNSSSVSSETD